MGQTEITGRCNSLMRKSLMRKNGEHIVVEFAGAKRCCLFVCGKSLSFLPNLADMCQKLLASFGLHMDRVPVAYQ
jgi:hypothetical protein